MVIVIHVSPMMISFMLLAKSLAADVAPISTATEEAIRALDTDNSGKVEKAEVEAFARNQGLSAAEVRKEFKDLDVNGDGELEADEIRSTLGDVNPAVASPMRAASSQSTSESGQLAAQPPIPEFKAVDTDRLFAGAPQANSSLTAFSFPMSQAGEPVANAANLQAGEPVANVANLMPNSPESELGAQNALPVAAAETMAATTSMHLEALEQEAQQHAGKALAEVFARTAAKTMETRSQDTARATKFEEAAKSLRGQSAELKRTATAQTVKAATDAAAAVLKQASVRVRALEQQAAKAEREAAQKRTDAKKAMEKALQAQNDITNAMHRLKTQDEVF